MPIQGVFLRWVLGGRKFYHCSNHHHNDSWRCCSGTLDTAPCTRTLRSPSWFVHRNLPKADIDAVHCCTGTRPGTFTRPDFSTLWNATPQPLTNPTYPDLWTETSGTPHGFCAPRCVPFCRLYFRTGRGKSEHVKRCRTFRVSPEPVEDYKFHLLMIYHLSMCNCNLDESLPFIAKANNSEASASSCMISWYCMKYELTSNSLQILRKPCACALSESPHLLRWEMGDWKKEIGQPSLHSINVGVMQACTNVWMSDRAAPPKDTTRSITFGQ